MARLHDESDYNKQSICPRLVRAQIWQGGLLTILPSEHQDNQVRPRTYNTMTSPATPLLRFCIRLVSRFFLFDFQNFQVTAFLSSVGFHINLASRSLTLHINRATLDVIDQSLITFRLRHGILSLYRITIHSSPSFEDSPSQTDLVRETETRPPSPEFYRFKTLLQPYRHTRRTHDLNVRVHNLFTPRSSTRVSDLSGWSLSFPFFSQSFQVALLLVIRGLCIYNRLFRA